jgi:hypothetical protein
VDGITQLRKAYSFGTWQSRLHGYGATSFIINTWNTGISCSNQGMLL